MSLTIAPELDPTDVPEGHSFVAVSTHLLAMMIKESGAEIVTWGKPTQPPRGVKWYEPVIRSGRNK